MICFCNAHFNWSEWKEDNLDNLDTLDNINDLEIEIIDLTHLSELGDEVMEPVAVETQDQETQTLEPDTHEWPTDSGPFQWRLIPEKIWDLLKNLM